MKTWWTFGDSHFCHYYRKLGEDLWEFLLDLGKATAISGGEVKHQTAKDCRGTIQCC